MEIAAAAITFGTAIWKVSEKLNALAKEIKYARREIEKLVKEMSIFADLYEDFYRVCIPDQRKQGRKTSSTKRLLDWIEDAIDAFESLVGRVRALAGDSRYSMLETLTAHVRWYFSKNEVNYLRYSLNVAQENMRGFSNLTIIKKINEEIQIIKDAIAQGDQQLIQNLENRLGISLEERLAELEKTRSVLSAHRDEFGS